MVLGSDEDRRFTDSRALLDFGLTRAVVAYFGPAATAERSRPDAAARRPRTHDETGKLQRRGVLFFDGGSTSGDTS